MVNISPLYTTDFSTNDHYLNLDANNNSSFDGSGTVWKDLSAQGNDGTISGATWNSDGYFIFDGTNDVVTIDSTLLPTTPEAYTAWVYPIPPPAGSFTNNPDYPIFGNSNDTSQYIIWNGNTLTVNGYNFPLQIVYNQWSHIHISNNFTNQMLLNHNGGNTVAGGSTYFSSAASAGIIVGDYNEIGAKTAGATPMYFDGYISKVRQLQSWLSSDLPRLYNEGP